MKKKLRNVLFAVVAALLVGSGFNINLVQAADIPGFDEACKTAGSGGVCANKDKTVEGLIPTVIKTLLFLIGAIAVIMIVFAGFQYATSAGDTGKVTKAKNTIMYAVIGLLVAILSYAIVSFVLNQI